ncbi:MAG TPA: ECF-type sigma factor [Blastocatellia bacterium]|nr:ECF-type sigma factor [Blastocatellia bacterium]
MLDLTSATFTTLFKRWHSGDQEAGEQLFRMIYQDLLRLAQNYLKNDRAGRAIQATTLVHEAYLRMFGKEKVEIENRAHFFVIATRQMRRILIDLSRRNRHAVVNHDLDSLLPEELLISAKAPNVDLLALDEALIELEKIDERACRVVELRYIGGLTEIEAAEVLQISVATLKRDWTFARTWLFGRLR